MSSSSSSSRREFLRQAGLASAAAALWKTELHAEDTVSLPFENGERPLVAYPQKRRLLRLTTRPPQLETPFPVFNEGALTANDAFFVRYHLTLSPPPMAMLGADAFKLSIGGKVDKPVQFSVQDLKTQFESVEVVAVNQCSGNGRGFFNPRMPGGQSGAGMMGNARWKGVRLKDVLAKAGIQASARQVTFDGLDAPLIPQTPDFVKALDADHVMDGEVMLAYEMNGEPLPWLNGYPLRLVAPGYYGTYWMKHVHKIQVLDEVFKGWWMSTAYRIPDNACACVPAGSKPSKTVPINRLNVRSFITNLSPDQTLPVGRPTPVRGIAFDGGEGIREVLVSVDGGRVWRPADLGADLGRYSFREWTASFTPEKPGEHVMLVRAVNRIGQTQPMEELWNPSGYMRNIVEQVKVRAA